MRFSVIKVIHFSRTDPGVMEFFELFLAILKVLNKGVLDKTIMKACQNKSVVQADMCYCIFICSVRQ